MLLLDNPDLQTERTYRQLPGERVERIFRKVEDIRASPNPDYICMDTLRYEELDYRFYY